MPHKGKGPKRGQRVATHKASKDKRKTVKKMTKGNTYE